jgi:hypothetical protein
MTTRTIAELVFRIWGVMLLVRAAMSIPAVLGLLAGTGETAIQAGMLFGSRVSYIATLLIQSALAVFVFAQAPLLARWAAKKDTNTSLSIDMSALYLVALSLFGITLIVDGLQELGVLLYTWFAIRNEAVDTVAIVLERRWETMTRAGIEVVLGVTLFAGREAIVRTWRSVRGIEA